MPNDRNNPFRRKKLPNPPTPHLPNLRPRLGRMEVGLVGLLVGFPTIPVWSGLGPLGGLISLFRQASKQADYYPYTIYLLN